MRGICWEHSVAEQPVAKVGSGSRVPKSPRHHASDTTTFGLTSPPHPSSLAPFHQDDTILALFDMMYEAHLVFLNQKWMGGCGTPGARGRAHSTTASRCTLP